MSGLAKRARTLRAATPKPRRAPRTIRHRCHHENRTVQMDWSGNILRDSCTCGARWSREEWRG